MYLSLQQQTETRENCRRCLQAPVLELQTKRHIAFLLRGLDPLSDGYVTLDAARPWLFYWCLTGLALLPDTEELIRARSSRLAETVAACQHPDGGFGGGYGQMAHLAPTYAAVLSLAVVADVEAYKVVDRPKLYTWLMSLKQEDGGFAIQRDGEVDARAAYLALSVASLLNLLTPELVHGTIDWLSQCQRYEGGLSGIHNAEAHGGLSYCTLAALCILDEPGKVLKRSLDLPAFLKWLTARQATEEGGYTGRTNKLVDGCYTWWVGGEFALVEAALGCGFSLFDRTAVKDYILQCCQISRRGGLRDKPEKQPDYYHTCYCLAGLSAAQYRYIYDSKIEIDQQLGNHSFAWRAESSGEHWNLDGTIGKIHPIYALPWGTAEKIRAWAVSQDSSVG